MKKYQFKLFSIPQTDLDVALNVEGQLAYHPIQAMQTPFGMKFLLERQLDEDVDLTADQQAASDALAAKFGIR